MFQSAQGDTIGGKVSLFELLVVLGLVAAALAFWANKRNEERLVRQLAAVEMKRLSDESLARKQVAFEKRLIDNIHLPDGIRWQQAFIYWNVMRGCYEQVIARHRYDPNICDRIKKDWLVYMDLLERRQTTAYLSMEGKKQKRDQWEAEAAAYTLEIEAIENAIAHLVGNEATTILQTVRGRSYNAFDRSGREPIAPIGYHYSMRSVDPYLEELVPD